MKLRIATYNMHKGVSAFGREARIHDMKEAIAGLNADLIFLQEVQGRHDNHAKRHSAWPQAGHHEFLADDSHHVAYGMNAVYEHGHHGNALLSRYPIISLVNHDVSDHAYEQRGILHAVVQIDTVAVHCFVIHLGLFAASRRRQIHALIQTIVRDTPPGAPLIIAGDFNDWNQRLSSTLYEHLGVDEAFDMAGRLGSTSPASGSLKTFFAPWRRSHARTFPAQFPCLCLDRVYLRGFQVEQATVLQHAPWRALSDHVPILVNLEMPLDAT
ncbi:endonuclease/exonuclease/phosphatase family protein [Undibacterium sp. MH2W]|uniref:endonuclease/exonuclease/phosphatase family protein n=1 Tax=Undibacterium sp. MH2W TaxID=3413044 RepID=UPI003BF158B8